MCNTKLSNAWNRKYTFLESKHFMTLHFFNVSVVFAKKNIKHYTCNVFLSYILILIIKLCSNSYFNWYVRRTVNRLFNVMFISGEQFVIIVKYIIVYTCVCIKNIENLKKDTYICFVYHIAHSQVIVKLHFKYISSLIIIYFSMIYLFIEI